MSLTPEEKQRIIEEEKLRAKVRKDMKKSRLGDNLAEHWDNLADAYADDLFGLHSPEYNKIEKYMMAFIWIVGGLIFVGVVVFVILAIMGSVYLD